MNTEHDHDPDAAVVTKTNTAIAAHCHLETGVGQRTCYGVLFRNWPIHRSPQREKVWRWAIQRRLFQPRDRDVQQLERKPPRRRTPAEDAEAKTQWEHASGQAAQLFEFMKVLKNPSKGGAAFDELIRQRGGQPIGDISDLSSEEFLELARDFAKLGAK